ncbi:hypothetical protein B7494_g5599 [Chlorociboria aeruginascens]|nr:hypothetical protein B7494_g5599 [Chlorociboria aeruginascens]
MRFTISGSQDPNLNDEIGKKKPFLAAGDMEQRARKEQLMSVDNSIGNAEGKTQEDHISAGSHESPVKRDTVQSIMKEFQRALRALGISDAHSTQGQEDEVGNQEEDRLRDPNDHLDPQILEDVQDSEESLADESVEDYQDACETPEGDVSSQPEPAHQSEHGFKLFPGYGKSLHIYLWKILDVDGLSTQVDPQAADCVPPRSSKRKAFSYTPSLADILGHPGFESSSHHIELQRDKPGERLYGLDSTDERDNNSDVSKDEVKEETTSIPADGAPGCFQLRPRLQKKYKLLPQIGERLRFYLWDVQVEDRSLNENHATSNFWKKVLSATDPDPTIWQVRRDFRNSCLEVYTASFGGEPMADQKIWLDPENGTVYYTEFKFQTRMSQADSIPPQPYDFGSQFNANSSIILIVDSRHESLDLECAANPTLRVSKFVKHEAEYTWNEDENVFEASAADIARHELFKPQGEILGNITEAFKELRGVTEVEIPIVKIVALEHIGGLKITDLELGRRIVIVIDEDEESVDGEWEDATQEPDTTDSLHKPERKQNIKAGEATEGLEAKTAMEEATGYQSQKDDPQERLDLALAAVESLRDTHGKELRWFC